MCIPGTWYIRLPGIICAVTSTPLLNRPRPREFAKIVARGREGPLYKQGARNMKRVVTLLRYLPFSVAIAMEFSRNLKETLLLFSDLNTTSI